MIDVLLLLLDELTGDTPFYILILAALFFGFVLFTLQKKYAFPRYILKSLIASAAAAFVFFFLCICMKLAKDAMSADSSPDRNLQKITLALAVTALFALSVIPAVLTAASAVFLGYKRKLDRAIRSTKAENFDYSLVAAWRELESLPPSRLTRRQRAKYEKYRLYIRMLLGNFSGIAEDLEKIREKNKAWYHFLKYVQCTAMGHMEDAAAEIRQAEELADEDTEPLIRVQIMLDRGTGYVGIGLYQPADDAFCRAITYGRKHRIKEKIVWELLYYNYAFNQTRLHPHMKRPQWEALLEPLKEHFDMKNPRDYMAFSNIELELLRQTGARRHEINENIYRSFRFLMQCEIPAYNRCVLEAGFARMIWSAMGDPTDVLKALEHDRELLLKMPMPARYNCFHQIDIFFTDLHGGIVEQYDLLKQSAHWYMINQAAQDLEEYRRSLPAEAVYERCFCLNELAGLCKRNPQEYRWEDAAAPVRNAAALFLENGLELEAIRCQLNLMDEATSLLNMDQSLELTRLDDMTDMLAEIEKSIPKFEKHPVMAEIALRLSFYCCAMHDYDRCKKYYESFAHLREIVSLQHFAPWMHRYCMVTGFTVRALWFLDAVHQIRKELADQTANTLADEWFLHFYDRNGAFESIALAKILGIDDHILLKTKLWPLADGDDFCRTAEGIAEHLWLFLPQLCMEIDVTYAQFTKDAKKDRIVFNQGHHPIELHQSNCLQQKNIDALPLFAATYVQEIHPASLSPEQQAALQEVCERIEAKLPEECPTVEELSALYRRTMLPVCADDEMGGF